MSEPELKMDFRQLVENNICPYCKGPLVDKKTMGEAKKVCTKCELEFDPE